MLIGTVFGFPLLGTFMEAKKTTRGGYLWRSPSVPDLAATTMASSKNAAAKFTTETCSTTLTISLT